MEERLDRVLNRLIRVRPWISDLLELVLLFFLFLAAAIFSFFPELLILVLRELDVSVCF